MSLLRMISLKHCSGCSLYYWVKRQGKTILSHPNGSFPISEFLKTTYFKFYVLIFLIMFLGKH